MMENPYERARAANIAKNRAIMVKLGILASDLRAHDGPSSSRGAREGDVAENSKPVRTAKRRRARATATEATMAVRRSSRRRVETSPVVDVDVEEEEEARDDAAHETAAREYASRHAGKQARAAIVGTNSYQHTLMRVRTMDDLSLIHI